MTFTDAEYVATLTELEKAGIKGEDAATSFAGVCALAGDTNYPTFLSSIKAISGANDEDTHRLIARRFGLDNVRIIRALQVHA